MFRFARNAMPPHLDMLFAGRVEVADLERHVLHIEEALHHLRPGFVILVDAAELTYMDQEAAGVMLYLVQRTFSARPGRILLVNPPSTVHQGLCTFAFQQDVQQRIQVFEGTEAAHTFLATLG